MDITAIARISVIVLGAVLGSGSAWAAPNDGTDPKHINGRLQPAQQETPETQFEIGEAYESGRGVRADVKKALAWYEKSARQGYIKAKFKVAYLYYRGEGVKRNPAAAFPLMLEVARTGHARAQYHVGLMYQRGDGVTKNLDEAYRWHARAARNDYSPAEDELAELRARVSERVRKEAEADAVAATADAPAPAEPLPAAVALLPGTQPALGLAAQPVTPARKSSRASKPPSVPDVLFGGGWISPSRTPAEFLPSAVTSCKSIDDAVIECLSGELSRAIGNAHIVYQTKSVVSIAGGNAQFKVAYRNNVLSVEYDKDERDEGEPGDEASVVNTIPLGWQETEHLLDCALDGDQAIHCVKNNVQKIVLSRETM
jgi:hypothetical protein